MKPNTMLMKLTRITTFLSSALALALLLCGCVTDTGAGPGSNNAAQADAAMTYLHNTDGWEVGVGPSIVVVDQGMARTLTTTTLQSDIYAFVFDQSGLMADAGLQGSKITRIGP
jgi:hypothetical protein